VRDWMMICAYIKELGMHRESAVEYNRLAQAWPDDALTVRACMEGGDSALMAKDEQLALRLYEQVLTKNPTDVYESRARQGIEKCLSTAGRQRWANNPSQQTAVPEPKPMTKPSR
jgi:lipopolysaccharide biosynthesis regulator YciM